MGTQEEILKLEKDALDQWASGRPSGYLMHAADDLTYFDDIGAQNGLRGLENVKAYARAALDGNIPPHNYKMVDPGIQVLGDVAVLTHHYHPSTFEGETLTPWRASCVYNKKDGRWQLVHAHWSMNKGGE